MFSAAAATEKLMVASLVAPTAMIAALTSVTADKMP
jgi:hypothetical protein